MAGHLSLPVDAPKGPQGGGGGFSGAAYAGLASVTTDFIAMYAFANIKRSSIDRREDSTMRTTTTTTTIDEDNSSYPSWTPARRTKHWIKNDAVVSATTRPCGRATLTVRRASGKYNTKAKESEHRVYGKHCSIHFCSSSLLQICFIVIVAISSILKHPKQVLFNPIKYIF